MDFYRYGESIITDSTGCTGMTCTTDGFVNWNNCTDTTTTPQSITTTPDTTPSTNTPISTLPCQYNGQAYALREVIPNDNRWCSGVTCTENGLVPWDNFNCTSTTTPQTITTTKRWKTTDNPYQMKKKQIKEKNEKKMLKKLEKFKKKKMNKKITRELFLEMKKKMKKSMRKKMIMKLKKIERMIKMKRKKMERRRMKKIKKIKE